jgi:hypothetical protein
MLPVFLLIPQAIQAIFMNPLLSIRLAVITRSAFADPLNTCPGEAFYMLHWARNKKYLYEIRGSHDSEY